MRERLCSRRERRWVDACRFAADLARVLSARAEVGRGAHDAELQAYSALRASGGGSLYELSPTSYGACSPRERRWVGADGSPREG